MSYLNRLTHTTIRCLLLICFIYYLPASRRSDHAHSVCNIRYLYSTRGYAYKTPSFRKSLHTRIADSYTSPHHTNKNRGSAPTNLKYTLRSDAHLLYTLGPLILKTSDNIKFADFSESERYVGLRATVALK